MIQPRILRRLAGRLRGAVRLAAHSGRELGAMAGRLLEVATLRVLSRSDYRRWTAPGSLEVWWDSRTKMLAALVPAGSRVIEFGAGRRQLELYLDPRCRYVPSDLIDRGPGTVVCDLNRRPFPDLRSLRLDVAVFGGVLEYIVDARALVEWLAASVSVCVASYACVATGPRLSDRIQARLERLRHGYMNHLTEAQIVALFRERGFICRARHTWDRQCLFLFEREGDVPATLPEGV